MRVKVGIVCMVLLGAFCGFEIYHQTGIVHTTKKNGYGCLCHNFDPTPSVAVWISGPDSLRAGTEALYRVNVAKSGNIAAGFNVAAYFGSLGIADSAGTKLESESSTDSLELTHIMSRFRSGTDTITWLFKYRAPMTVGWIDTLYAAGNSVNNDTTPDGDTWNFGNNFTVRVVRPNSVAYQSTIPTYTLAQNYPNPFNPSTTIRYEIPYQAQVKVDVFDISGKEIGTLVNELQTAGPHETLFDSKSMGKLSSGIYFYRLSVLATDSKSFTGVKKMVFMK